MFFKIGGPKSSARFTGKCLYQSLFSNKMRGLRPATLLKRSLWYRCFPVNFAKFLRITFFIKLPWWLLLLLRSLVLLFRCHFFIYSNIILWLMDLLPWLLYYIIALRNGYDYDRTYASCSLSCWQRTLNLRYDLYVKVYSLANLEKVLTS